MQQFFAPNAGQTEENQPLKDKPVYVGVNPHSSRIAVKEENEKSTKKTVPEGSTTPGMVNKFKRTISDGLLLVPDAPIVTAGLIVKVGLTVTNLLHEVDLVLGMNWLQLVNPVVDWGSGRLYIPNAAHTALLQGDWLEGHVQSGTVTVLSSAKELKSLQDQRMQRQIAIFKNPNFGQILPQIQF